MIYDLRGPQGNVFAIISFVEKYMKEHGFDREERTSILEDMQSSTYRHALHVARRTVPGLKFRNLPPFKG